MGASLGKTDLFLRADIPAQKGLGSGAPAASRRPSPSKSLPLLSWLPIPLLRASKRASRGQPATPSRPFLTSPRRRYLLQQARHSLLAPLAAVCWNSRQMKALSRRLSSGVTPRAPPQKGRPWPPPAQEQTTGSSARPASSRDAPDSGAEEPLAKLLQDKDTKTMAGGEQGSASGPGHKRRRLEGIGDGEPSRRPASLERGLAAQGSHQPLEERSHPSSEGSPTSGRTGDKPGSSQNGLACQSGSAGTMAQPCKRPGPVSLSQPKKAREEAPPGHPSSSAAAPAPDTQAPAASHGEASDKARGSPATSRRAQRRVRFRIDNQQPSACARPGPPFPALPEGLSSWSPSASNTSRATSRATSSSTQAAATRPAVGIVGSPTSRWLSSTCTGAAVELAAHSGSRPDPRESSTSTSTPPRSIFGAPLDFAAGCPGSLDCQGHLCKPRASPSSVAATCSSSTGVPSPLSPSPASASREASLTSNRTARPAFLFPFASRNKPALRVHPRVRTKLAFEDKPVLAASFGCSLMLRKPEAAHTPAEPGPAPAPGQAALGGPGWATLGGQEGPASTFQAPGHTQASLSHRSTSGCGVFSQATTRTSTISTRIASLSRGLFSSGGLAASTMAAPNTSSSSGAFRFPASMCVGHGPQPPLLWSLLRSSQGSRAFGPSGAGAPVLVTGVAPQGLEAPWQYTSKK